jgi:IS5 family transposase
MKFALSLILFVALVPMLIADAAAQSNSGAAQSVAELRARLADVEAKENELQARVRQLDEALKPENIERSLAGIGSTKPEELREHRRRQLTIERDGVRAQLNLLATSRERLQAAIRTAEGTAYQQSAEGVATSQEQTMVAQTTGSSRLAVVMLAFLAALCGLAVVIFLARRSSRKSTQP